MFERFHNSIYDYYPDEKEIDCALDILRLGMEILASAKIYCEDYLSHGFVDAKTLSEES